MEVWLLLAAAAVGAAGLWYSYKRRSGKGGDGKK